MPAAEAGVGCRCHSHAGSGPPLHPADFQLMFIAVPDGVETGGPPADALLLEFELAAADKSTAARAHLLQSSDRLQTDCRPAKHSGGRKTGARERGQGRVGL